MRNSERAWPAIVVALGLTAATAAAYHGVFQLGFVYDDQSYLTENRRLQEGFSPRSLWWALTATHAANWHPLTWLSHLLDVRLFALEPAGHHGTNLLLHLIATALLFHALRRYTGRLWPSAAVAAVFALHPLHVETVAWVSERKDVLCALFWMLTLLAYRRYCERPGAGRSAVVFATTALALMAKPMAVTLPCVLLLLDYWPLARLPGRPLFPRALRLAAEKIPLFALAAAASAVTVYAQQGGGAVFGLSVFGFLPRLANAVVSLAAYVGTSLWPHRLAVYYPLPAAGHPPWLVALCAALLAGGTAAAVHFARRLPFLTVGWFWFAGTLVPVIGLVQVGMQARADRYTYLPQIGLAVALVWTGAALLASRPVLRRAAAAAGAVVLVLLAARTGAQVPVWRDNVSLYSHAVATTGENWVMRYFLALALAKAGRQEEAGLQYAETVRLQPLHAEARAALAETLVLLGRFDEAAAQYRQALRVKPLAGAWHKGLGAALEGAGNLDEAVAAYREALRLEPGNGFYRALLDGALARRPGASGADTAAAPAPERARADELARRGNALAGAGRYEEALAAYREAIGLDPAAADTWNNLGSTYGNLGRLREAEAAFREAVRLRPGHAHAQTNLRRVLSR